MIVCHCNVICSERISSAVRDAMEEFPGCAITPALVYARCRAVPDCGNCKLKIRKIMEDIASETVFTPTVDRPARAQVPVRRAAP